MTNAEIIQAIKTEIERLKAKYRKDMYKSNHEGLASGYKIEAYNELLSFLSSFLSTLESEKPVPNDIEEAAVDIADALLAKPKDYVLSAKADYWNGAHDGIIAGAKWKKEQMMKEAVEGIVTTRSMAGNIVTAHVDYRYKDGQKVRIIIVKED